MIQVKNNPATKKQLWALFCITKKDYRNQNITFDEADKIIKEANAKKENTTPIQITTNKTKCKKSDMLDFFMENLDNIKNKLFTELSIKSIITDDLNPNNKKYIFMGGGCGFSHLSIDKRNKKANDELEKWNQVKKVFEKNLIKSIDKKILYDMEKSGNPLEAHLMQNLKYNSILMGYLSQYLTKNFNAKVTIRNIYD